MPRFQRIPLAGRVLILAALSACAGSEGRSPVELDKAEIRLVDETLLMIRVRLTATTDSVAAAELLRGAGELYTAKERELLLDRLAQDSARGEKVMSALHDSLEAMRGRLFVPTQP